MSYTLKTTYLYLYLEASLNILKDSLNFPRRRCFSRENRFEIDSPCGIYHAKTWSSLQSFVGQIIILLHVFWMVRWPILFPDILSVVWLAFKTKTDLYLYSRMGNLFVKLVNLIAVPATFWPCWENLRFDTIVTHCKFLSFVLLTSK